MNTRAPDRRTRPALLVACVLVFIASTWVTIAWCGAVCDMPGMGVWSRMPGQPWLEHFLVFEGMWSVMMIAMMMPVFAPTLVGSEVTSPVPVAGGYFAAWTLAGLAIYPIGLAIAAADVAPAAGGVVVLLAGAWQFTRRKARQLQCCRVIRGEGWRQGWDSGVRCIRCCAGLSAALLVVGVMDVMALALVTVAMAAERLLPATARAAHVIGAILVALGLFLCARAFGW